MLDKDSLSQLKQLKRQIEDDKEFALGTVKGTQRKFGFLVTEDKREIYLSPEEMLKVFPGDVIKAQIFTQKTQGKSDKTYAEVKKLRETTVKRFAGRYIVKGKGHFIEPDLHNNRRWIFVPPAARNRAKDGDFVVGQLSRHPYPHGKPQAEVLNVIGTADQASIEADYMIAKFELAQAWPDNWQQQLLNLDEQAGGGSAEDHPPRADLSAVPFITIDSPATQDMDDALCAEPCDTGWTLQVAIADPSALITPNSDLDKLIRKRATSVYLPGKSVAMLPEGLANDRCSLLPGELRPALVCRISINHDGAINSYTFCEALVRSHAKLSYRQVAKFIAQEDAADQQESNSSDDQSCQEHADSLSALMAASEALLAHRQRHNLVIPNRQDYRLILDDHKKLERIEPIIKNTAQQLVEECMVATNRCAAELLGEQGIFIEHPGFRQERLADVNKLAAEQLQMSDVDFSSPEGYRQLMSAIDDEALDFPLRAVLSRLLERSRFSSKPRPHQGMGLSRYTTLTSPLRKYSDLTAHRLLKARLKNQSLPDLCDAALLEALQAGQDRARQASAQTEQWLKCQYMEKLLRTEQEGEVTQVNSNGFSVRLDQHWIEGFVETRKLDQKYSFDPMRLRLKSHERVIELGQRIKVKVSEVDCAQRRIRFSMLATESGSKPENKDAEVARPETA